MSFKCNTVMGFLIYIPSVPWQYRCSNSDIYISLHGCEPAPIPLQVFPLTWVKQSLFCLPVSVRWQPFICERQIIFCSTVLFPSLFSPEYSATLQFLINVLLPLNCLLLWGSQCSLFFETHLSNSSNPSVTTQLSLFQGSMPFFVLCPL